MGYCKVVNKGNGKVILVHQLDQAGNAYAEDVTIEVQRGGDPSRISYLSSLDGRVGMLSYSFTPTEMDTSSLKFPEV